jgi:hypothetical protein
VVLGYEIDAGHSAAVDIARAAALAAVVVTGDYEN